MRLIDMITQVQDLRPNTISAQTLTQFINEVEAAAADRVFKTEYVPLNYDTDAEKELSIPDQYSGVYLSYVFAKIDYVNAETSRYNMDAAQYEAEWNEFASWYRRNNIPVPKCILEPVVPAEDPLDQR